MNQGMIELANLAARLASNFLVHSTILIVVALVGAKFLVKRTAARSLLLRWVLVAAVVLPLVAAGMSYWGVSFLLLPLPEAKLMEPVETPQTVAAEPLGHHAGFEPPPPVEHTPPARVEPEHNPPGVPRSSPGPEPLLPDAMVSAPVAAPDVPGRPAAERKAPRPNAVTYAYAAFGVLWGAGALALLVHLAFCHASLARLRRAARAVSHKAILAELAELSRRKGVRPPSLLSSGRLRSPLLTGFLRPAIIVPESFPRGAPLRAVLLHELAHLARHDCLVNLLVRLLCAVAFFQPLVWLLARRMEEVSDEVADDVVLSEGVAPSSYARNLADWAERYLPAGRESHAGVGVIRFKSGVGRRVQRILDTARRLATKVSPTTALAIVLGVGVAAAIVAGCVGVGPQSPATGIAALAEAKSLTIERIVLPPPPAPVQVTLTDASEIAEVVARMPRKDSGFAVGSVTRYRLRFAMPDGSAREYSVDPDGRLSSCSGPRRGRRPRCSDTWSRSSPISLRCGKLQLRPWSRWGRRGRRRRPRWSRRVGTSTEGLRPPPSAGRTGTVRPS